MSEAEVAALRERIEPLLGRIFFPLVSNDRHAFLPAMGSTQCTLPWLWIVLRDCQFVCGYTDLLLLEAAN